MKHKPKKLNFFLQIIKGFITSVFLKMLKIKTYQKTTIKVFFKFINNKLKPLEIIEFKLIYECHKKS